MLKVAIAGASGFGGGELLRLLFSHPEVEVTQATSTRFEGKPLSKVHPNLRKRTSLKFCRIEDLEACDLLFLGLPHGKAMARWEHFSRIAPRIIDLSGDFRLQTPEAYLAAYGTPHLKETMLGKFTYGIPELYRDSIREANFVACAGCNATVSILALRPLFLDRWLSSNPTVIDVKVGSSEAGNRATEGSHHPIRSGAMRSYKPTGHRHLSEIRQELGDGEGHPFHFSATAVEQVRGILATCHLFPNRILSEKDLWKRYREVYGQEPFIRIVKERDGLYRYPEPKLLAGTNFCDIGFELDASGERLVVIAAIDNLMKGAAGQAVQNLNIMFGFEETTSLEFPGLHPL